jgi:hypothetical protein
MVTLQRGRERSFKEIGRYDTAELALQSFRALMALEGREIHYTRHWVYEDGWTYIDYGSHTDFFRYREEQQ